MRANGLAERLGLRQFEPIVGILDEGYFRSPVRQASEWSYGQAPYEGHKSLRAGFSIARWQDKFNHIVILSRGMAFLQFGEPLPLSHFLQPLTMRRGRRSPPFSGIQLRSEEIPRLCSKMPSCNLDFRNCAGRQEY